MLCSLHHLQITIWTYYTDLRLAQDSSYSIRCQTIISSDQSESTNRLNKFYSRLRHEVWVENVKRLMSTIEWMEGI